MLRRWRIRNNRSHDVRTRAPRSRQAGIDWSFMAGAMSIVTFWAFGIGIVLGALAVAGAVWSTRGPEAADAPERADVAIAIAIGASGMVAGAGFLLLVLPP